MICECSHMSWHHSTVTYPKRAEPCEKCLSCGGENPGPGRDCCLSPRLCPCGNFTRATAAAETAGAA